MKHMLISDYNEYSEVADQKTFLVIADTGIMEFTGDSIPPVLTVLSTTRKEIADMPPHTVWECMLAESCKLVTLSADDRRFESTTWSEAITELAVRLEIDMYRTYGITGDMLQQAIRAYFPHHAHWLDNGGVEPKPDASVMEYMQLQQQYRIAKAESERIQNALDHQEKLAKLRAYINELSIFNGKHAPKSMDTILNLR